MLFEILPALALGFVMGRIWQIRRYELQRPVIVEVPPIARIPLPKGAQLSAQASASADHPDQSDLFPRAIRRVTPAPRPWRYLRASTLP